MAKILIPEALQRFTNGQTSLQLPGKDMRACLKNLAKSHSPLAKVLIDDGERLNGYVNLYLNGQPVNNQSTPTSPEDVLELLVSVSGG